VVEIKIVSSPNDRINHYCTANCTSIKVSQKKLKYRACTRRLTIDIGRDQSTLVGEFFKHDFTHFIPLHGTQS
jgi:hypothetical protein